MTTPDVVREVMRDWLCREMSDISEETICAGWESGLEYRLWQAVESLPEPHKYGISEIEPKRIQRLRDVAEWLGEWVVWRDGETFIPLSEWKSEYVAWLNDKTSSVE